MIVDSQSQLCAAQALTSDANATNILDLGVARNLGDGSQLAVVIDVDVAADHTTGDETYTFNVVTSANSDLSSPTTIATVSPAASALTAGSRQIIQIPIGVTLSQYLGLAFDGGGTTPTITITAYLMPVSLIDKFRSYKDNSTIS